MRKIPKKKITLEDLAIMVAKGFAGVDKRFDGVELRLDRVEEQLDNVENELVSINSRFVPWYAFESLVNRIDIIERKDQIT